MADHNPTDAVSRRNVLKTTGGLLAGATLLAGIGGAQTEEGLQFEIEEASEEVIVARVRVPAELADRSEFPGLVYLGHVDQFDIDGDTVRLPENTERLAKPAEVERLDEGTFRMYFRTRDTSLADVEDWEEIPLGLGVFPERRMPIRYFDLLHQPAGSGRSSPTSTSTATPATPEPENGKLKFAHFTPYAVCSIELEHLRSGRTIELLDLPNTHDKLKPRTYFSYASADYSQIKTNAIYKLTATTCDGNHSATQHRFQFDRGGVWTIRSW